MQTRRSDLTEECDCIIISHLLGSVVWVSSIGYLQSESGFHSTAPDQDKEIEIDRWTEGPFQSHSMACRKGDLTEVVFSVDMLPPSPVRLGGINPVAIILPETKLWSFHCQWSQAMDVLIAIDSSKYQVDILR